MKKPNAKPASPKPPAAQPTTPVDVVDGIPDRATGTGKWKYALIATAFVAWVAFLIFCQNAGRPGQ